MNLNKLFLNYCKKNNLEINPNQLDLIEELNLFYNQNFNKSLLNCSNTISSALFLLRSLFHSFTCKAIRIPITTSIISPKAYFRYFPFFPSKSKFCLIFLKNFIIGLLVGHNEAQHVI